MKSRPLWVAVILGAITGGVLVAIEALVQRKAFMLVPYAVLMVGTLIYLRRARGSTFARRFGFALVAFMTATMILYTYVITRANTAAGVGSIFLIVAIVAAASTLVAALSDRLQRP
jgi:FtsH-binding integral membrane protein